MTRVVAVTALLLAGTVACGGAAAPLGTSSNHPSPLASATPAAGTAAHNRSATQSEARRLLGLAPLPAGATATSQRPQPLDGPALGEPSTDSLVDVHRYWYVDQPFSAVWSYIRSHRPEGLSQAGLGSSNDSTGTLSEGIGWSEPQHGYAVGLQLDVAVAWSSNRLGTVIRADGMGEWLDPRPMQDDGAGPRMRLEVAHSCTRSDKQDVSVDNTGSDLDQQLLPDAQPTGALICEYGGLNITPRFSLGDSTRLGAAGARRLANRFRLLPIAHTHAGVHSCPMDDGSANVIAFSYAGRPDVDLWAPANGCQWVGNGKIAVNGGVGLGHWIAPLTLHPVRSPRPTP